MHLHDVLRLWRAEVFASETQVAVVEEDLQGDRSILGGVPHEMLPGGLRRDDPAALAVRLLPAAHAPNRPASEDTLDDLEERLGFELPRGVELLFRLHDGGDFWRPTIPGLDGPPAKPLHLLSAAQCAAAYAELLDGLREQLGRIDPDEDDLFRMARRFGLPRDGARPFASKLRAVLAGAVGGLPILPLLRSPIRPKDLVVLVPEAGAIGRVGYMSAASGFLPDHSDDLAFDGLQGWLTALLKGRACQRLILT